MSQPHVYVRIQPREYASSDDRCVTVNLSHILLSETLCVLDFPDPNAGIAAMLYTNEATVERVTAMRRDAAELLSKTLTKATIAAFGQRDTRMGYPK